MRARGRAAHPFEQPLGDLFGDGVLQPAGFGVGLEPVQPELVGEPPLHDPVGTYDPRPAPAPRGGERDGPRRRPPQEPRVDQAADRGAHRRKRHAEPLGDAGQARFLALGLEVVDRLEVAAERG